MSSNDRILIVDDDRSFRHLLLQGLGDCEYNLSTASTVAECVRLISERPPDLLLLDLNLPDGDGIEVLRSVRDADSDLPIILITGEGDSDSAILASRFGARDYLTKPVVLPKLRDVVRAVLARNGKTVTTVSSEATDYLAPSESTDLFVGRSVGMQNVFKSIGRVARQQVAVLVRGESGVGKELVARAIWKHSDRAEEKFLAVNCAALGGELLESELFGHEKGAFTGADRQHRGKFEVCNDGTLFLDEVGDMPAAMQAKLLRVLQERTFTRVGGNRVIRTNARIISATNRDLEQMSRVGEFRADLFHRLNGFTIDVPPLRERGNDVELLISHFLYRNNLRLSKKFDGMAYKAVRRLTDYSWPGNVRELESTLGQVMLNTHGSTIELTDLPNHIQVSKRPAQSEASHAASQTTPLSPVNGDFETFVHALVDGDTNGLYEQVIDRAERLLFSSVLSATRGNQSAAAKRLGITRGSLRFKLKKLGLTIDNEVNVPHRPRS